jgi:hypothetical protein
VLHAFDSTDGWVPLGGLIQGSGGNFYDTTIAGGANPNLIMGGPGTMFAALAVCAIVRKEFHQGSFGGPITGVPTGAAAPTSSVTLLLGVSFWYPPFVVHTFPDGSIAIAKAPTIPPPV